MKNKTTYKIGDLTFIVVPKDLPEPKRETKPSENRQVPFSPCMPQRTRPTGLWFIEG